MPGPETRSLAQKPGMAPLGPLGLYQGIWGVEAPQFQGSLGEPLHPVLRLQKELSGVAMILDQ